MSKPKTTAPEYFSPKSGKMKKQGKAKPRFLTVVENLAKAKTKHLSINCDLLTVTDKYFNFSAEYDFGDLTASVETKDLLEVAKLIQDEPFKVIPDYATRQLEFVWAGGATRIGAAPPTNEEHATGHPELDQHIKRGFPEVLFVAGAGVGKGGFFDKNVDLAKNYNLDRVLFDGTHAYSSDGYLLAKSIFEHGFGRTLTIHGSAYRLYRNLDLPPFEDVDGCWEVYERGLSIKFEGGFELFCLEPPKRRFPDISRFTNEPSCPVKIPADFWKIVKKVEKSSWIEIKGSTLSDSTGKSFQLPTSIPVFQSNGLDHQERAPFRCRPQSLLRLVELVSEGSRMSFDTRQTDAGTESWLTVKDPCGDFFYLAGLYRKVNG